MHPYGAGLSPYKNSFWQVGFGAFGEIYRKLHRTRVAPIGCAGSIGGCIFRKANAVYRQSELSTRADRMSLASPNVHRAFRNEDKWKIINGISILCCVHWTGFCCVCFVGFCVQTTIRRYWTFWKSIIKRYVLISWLNFRYNLIADT